MLLRMSSLFLRTLREDPADAEVPSHRLLVRAGYVRRVAPGIFSWLPLGYLVYRNVENIIREQTFCCGSGSGLGTDENFEMRMRGGLPRANAVKYVKEKYGVNLLTCICAIDKATLPTLLEYWVPGVEVAGIHELVGNALVMRGEKERLTDLRGEPLGEKEVAHA